MSEVDLSPSSHPSFPPSFPPSLGSGAFILLAHLSLRWGNTQHPRQQVQTGLVTIWGLRLGLFLFLRILKEGRDRRFHGVRDHPGTFFIYWTMQVLERNFFHQECVHISLLKQLSLLLQRFKVQHGSGVANLELQGRELACGTNLGKFIQSGLWAYSRHPNYLGEIVLWTGLFVSATSVLHGWQYISIVSPLFVWYLLNYVSGIPLLEKAAMKRWGKEAAFQAYLQKTPILWPIGRQ
ncbi:hypothetical protein JD844_011075 [Phrynosoma platyrhinos]|uniref:Steroid 5-alpha reductase C-terminal domain-containing protein n=1 Tax=Phrynosoma platyrhinos TaxID=52577 RepID=A0ABQ7TIC2_PHRPL|nr:hypothetical protein JD844_011075 [Phrynosoma platyrhinos]